MTKYARKIALIGADVSDSLLGEFVEKCIRDGVYLIAVVGERCVEIENAMDDMIVGDATDETRFLLTSAHAGETIEDAIEYAEVFEDDHPGPVQILKLHAARQDQEEYIDAVVSS